MPFLCNYPVAVDVATKPYVELHDYLAGHPDEREAALATLAFDSECRVGPGIGAGGGGPALTGV